MMLIVLTSASNQLAGVPAAGIDNLLVLGTTLIGPILLGLLFERWVPQRFWDDGKPRLWLFVSLIAVAFAVLFIVMIGTSMHTGILHCYARGAKSCTDDTMQNSPTNFWGGYVLIASVVVAAIVFVVGGARAWIRARREDD